MTSLSLFWFADKLLHLLPQEFQCGRVKRGELRLFVCSSALCPQKQQTPHITHISQLERIKRFKCLHKKTKTSQQCVSLAIPQHWDIYLKPDLGSKAFQSCLLCRLVRPSDQTRMHNCTYCNVYGRIS